MIIKFDNKQAVVGSDCLIFENTTIIGDVEIGNNVSIWPYVTLRGDMDYIKVGDFTNIQESSVIHTNYDCPTIIGDSVTIGHNAIVHGAKIGCNCLIGMGAILLDGCVVEEGAVVAAGCVVPPGKIVKKNHLAIGNPMQQRLLTDEQRRPFIENTKTYVELTKKYLMEEK